MSLQDLPRKHGPVTAADLPIRSGPRVGRRAFTDEEEERIYLFVHEHKNPPELAAVACRATVATVYAALARVRGRAGQPAGGRPPRRKGEA